MDGKVVELGGEDAMAALAPRAMQASKPPAQQSSSARIATAPPPAGSSPAVIEPSEADVRAALTKHGYGGREASRALGLASRYDLLKLMKKYGIPVPGE